MSQRPSWTIPSVIDFECFLAADAGADEEHLRTRDREIYTREIQPALPTDRETKRSSIFHTWLKARRRESGEPSPGEQIAAGFQTLVTVAALVGLGMGGSVTAALLHYKGSEPVNVSWFAACTVGIQMIVFAAAIAIWIIRKTSNVLDDFHPLRVVLSTLLWTFSASLRRLPGEQRERLRRTLAVLSRKREIYGSMAIWPFLIVTQLFAVGFNVGIITVLLAHVTFTDLDFGWQSTFVSSPEAAHRVAWLLSLPWHWAPSAYPTLQDMTESHFEYKVGLGGLSKSALKSWWPFLTYLVVFYGLLLRGSLFILAVVELRIGLAGLEFNHEGCNALFRRLTGPLVAPQAGTAVLEIPHAPAPLPMHEPRAGECYALLAADAEMPEADLAKYAKDKFGWHLARTLTANIDHPGGNAELIGSLEKSGGTLAGVLVIARSKRPPIKAIALFLQKVTAAAGNSPETILLLIGRKEGETFARVPDDEYGYWRNFHAINGLRLTLERWTPS